MIPKAPSPFLFLLPFALGPACGGAVGASILLGEDHAHEGELEPVSLTLFGERVLLFVDHPRLVRAEPARFLVHLSVLETGEPVRAGSVTLRIGSTELRVDAPKRDGLFVPEASFPEAGRFPTRLSVAGEQVEESFDLGSVVVHATPDDAARAAAEEAGEEPEAGVPFLMEQQWLVRLLLAEARPGRLEEHLVVPARVAAPEGASAVVSAPLGGRLLSARDAAFPRTGDAVSAGQVLAWVEPPLAAPDAAQLRALDLQLDLEALDVQRETAAAGARLRFAERELERLGRLRAEGLATRPQVERAEQDLTVARAESEAAASRQIALDELRARRNGPDAAAGERRHPLEASLAGTLVEVHRAPGESVEAGEPIFRVLDASRLWIEGRVLEFDLPRVRSTAGARATFEAFPDRRLALEPYSGGAPWIEPEVDPDSRTVGIRYEVANPDGDLRIGMLAQLEIVTATADAAVTIPLEAVVMDQGFPTAYVMLAGELFQRRMLELGLRDGDRVEVRNGIAPGEHVATRGAHLVRLAAMSPASFGHGHAH